LSPATLPGSGVDQLLQLQWRPFALSLPRPLHTAYGTLTLRRGWLLRLRSAAGGQGWGEAAPLAAPLIQPCAAQINALGSVQQRGALEEFLASPLCPGPLGFALGGALAELDGLVGGAVGALAPGWLKAPPGAQLLPAGAGALEALSDVLAAKTVAGVATPACERPSFKWKVAVHADAEERVLLDKLLVLLPSAAQLRLDANGHWSRTTAAHWVQRLCHEPRLQWLEQPLAAHDLEGLAALASQLPVALDESLQLQPQLRRTWPGWQVRRPSQEGDPRPLLAELQAGRPQIVLSTAFETGIGRRWLEHLAALQALGPSPAAPGLAPGWQPIGPLMQADPLAVWQAAA
jgi:O-succinylbenzoate synthase